MTLDELLPAARALPQLDKVRLIQFLAGDLLAPPPPVPGEKPTVVALRQPRGRFFPPRRSRG